MKLSVTDLAKKLQMDEETLSALEGGSFSMKPVYHRRSNTLSIQLHLEKALSFGVRERLARMQKELQVKVDLRVEAADGTVGIMDLLDYLQHFVSLGSRSCASSRRRFPRCKRKISSIRCAAMRRSPRWRRACRRCMII
ncbi:MAG: hypothetical protein V8T10_03325 [Merdibacter sp.]